MSDFEKLKRDNPSDDRVEAVYQKKDEAQIIAVKKPTIFSVLLATLKRDKTYLENANTAKRLPTLSHFVLSVFIVAALTITLVICYFSVDKAVFIPLALVFIPLAMPAMVLVFYYELDVERSISLFKFSLTFVLGFIFYLFLNFLNKKVLYQISFYSNIERYVFPIIYTALLFFLTFLLSNVYKATSLPSCFLIAVTLSMSCYIIENLTNNFSTLFLTVKKEQVIEGGYLYPSVNAIIMEDGYLTQSISNLFNDWFLKFMFMPYMYAAWAMIVGAVVSTVLEVRNKKGNSPKSVYLLLMLVIFFRYIADISTTIALFDIILSFMSFIGTFYVSTRFLNSYIGGN